MKNKNSNTVSIIMATYNRSHIIIESIQSIKNQSFTDWECLIIDDGGSDDTLAVITPILEMDTRFKYLKRPEKYLKGLPGCRNYGLDTAKGDYIIFFDDDDIVHPENLSICVEAINQYEVGYIRYLREVFSGDFLLDFDRDRNFDIDKHAVDDLSNMIMGKLPFNSCQVLWKNSCFEYIRFNEKLMYAEEWECYTRVLATGINGVTVNKTLFYGRKHENSNTGEFKNNNPKRKASKILASKNIIEHLRNLDLFSQNLESYFIGLSLNLNSYSLLDFILKRSKNGIYYNLKYKAGFLCYPILKPIFKLKAKLISN